MSEDAARRTEQARQAALLRAIQAPASNQTGLPEGWSGSAQGLAAYQRHALATARAVLRQSHPTVLAMLGHEALDAMAVALWQQAPPERGDLGEWGADLAAALAQQPALQAWPWLADCARLDWARHQCERAADTPTDTDSLARLGDTPPEHLRLHLHPCVHVLPSIWPLADLFEAHQASSLSEALRQPEPLPQRGHTVVWRRPWRAEVTTLPRTMGAWMQALHTDTPAPLSTLLDEAQADFDVTAWLTRALSDGWLWKVSVHTD